MKKSTHRIGVASTVEVSSIFNNPIFKFYSQIAGVAVVLYGSAALYDKCTEKEDYIHVDLVDLNNPEKVQHLGYKYRSGGLAEDKIQFDKESGYYKLMLPNGLSIYRLPNTITFAEIEKPGKQDNYSSFTNPADQFDNPGYLNRKLARVTVYQEDRKAPPETFIMEAEYTHGMKSSKMTYSLIRFGEKEVWIDAGKKINGEKILEPNTQITLPSNRVPEVVYFTGNDQMISSPEHLRKLLGYSRGKQNSEIKIPIERPIEPENNRADKMNIKR